MTHQDLHAWEHKVQDAILRLDVLGRPASAQAIADELGDGVLMVSYQLDKMVQYRKLDDFIRDGLRTYGVSR